MCSGGLLDEAWFDAQEGWAADDHWVPEAWFDAEAAEEERAEITFQTRESGQ